MIRKSRPEGKTRQTPHKNSPGKASGNSFHQAMMSTHGQNRTVTWEGPNATLRTWKYRPTTRTDYYTSQLIGQPSIPLVNRSNPIDFFFPRGNFVLPTGNLPWTVPGEMKAYSGQEALDLFYGTQTNEFSEDKPMTRDDYPITTPDKAIEEIPQDILPSAIRAAVNYRYVQEYERELFERNYPLGDPADLPQRPPYNDPVVPDDSPQPDPKLPPYVEPPKYIAPDVKPYEAPCFHWKYNVQTKTFQKVPCTKSKTYNDARRMGTSRQTYRRSTTNYNHRFRSRRYRNPYYTLDRNRRSHYKTAYRNWWED